MREGGWTWLDRTGEGYKGGHMKKRGGAQWGTSGDNRSRCTEGYKKVKRGYKESTEGYKEGA